MTKYEPNINRCIGRAIRTADSIKTQADFFTQDGIGENVKHSTLLQIGLQAEMIEADLKAFRDVLQNKDYALIKRVSATEHITIPLSKAIGGDDETKG